RTVDLAPGIPPVFLLLAGRIAALGALRRPFFRRAGVKRRLAGGLAHTVQDFFAVHIVGMYAFPFTAERIAFFRSVRHAAVLATPVDDIAAAKAAFHKGPPFLFTFSVPNFLCTWYFIIIQDSAAKEQSLF